MTTPAWDPWRYRDPSLTTGTQNIVGFAVEATDGHIGKIDEASFDVGAGHVVVDTGPWIFGRKVVLPAGTIERVDLTTTRCTSTGPRPRSRTLRSSKT